MDSALTSLLNQGSALGARPACARAGAATATRASRRTRPTRRPTARSRSRSATTACSRGCARRSALPELAGDERFATNAARVAHVDELAERARGRVPRREPADHWVERPARRQRPGRPDQRRRRGLRAGRGARPGADRRGRRRAAARAAAAARRRAAADPPPAAALDEHGDEIRAWLAGTEPLAARSSRLVRRSTGVRDPSTQWPCRRSSRMPARFGTPQPRMPGPARAARGRRARAPGRGRGRA